ncbi:MAG TPA: response regulator [Burkholderiaceae bacterium]|nr:response regulator [Burkholderiaceae bacterium]
MNDSSEGGISAGAEPQGDAPVNILIVDDEPGNLVVLETVLDDPGYRLVLAKSADEALLALVREDFALLILDIRMPGMTGFELAQMIKERKKSASIPIIFLTAYYDKDQHVSEGYSTGAVDFLNKPVNPAVLRSKVAVFVDLHRKRRAISLANLRLTAEVAERRRIEEELRQLNLTLEQRVEERTNALHEADRQLREMMGSITDGLLMLDRDWRFTYANEQGARLIGAPAEELIGACLWELSPVVGAAGEHYRRAIATGRTVSFEQFYPEPIGRWFQCHCYPSRAGLSVYFLDINVRHEVDVRREQLLGAEQAARREGERVVRAKEEFLTSLSHELRTPLAAILGWTTLLQRPSLEAKTLRRGIEVIARNAKAQSQLVADLLDVSRIVSGKLRMNVERVDLNAVFSDAADAARPGAQAKGVEIDARLAGSPMVINGDPTRLNQIASNLISNALKFTPAGGRVTIVTRATEPGVEVDVSDTGEGIDEEFLPYVFDRFSQGDGSAARVHGGLGLGLSIVKSLVEQHGGSVEAQSGGKGRGSSFRLSFARDAQLRVDAPTSELGILEADVVSALPPEDADLRGIHVLLVDDHEDVLEVGLRLLEECGARVTTASSGEQALDRLSSEPFEVLLSDLGMPGMDGYALIRAVRADLRLTADLLPAAAVTAFVRSEDRRRALDDGFQVVIQKPVTRAALTQTILELAAMRRPQKAA